MFLQVSSQAIILVLPSKHGVSVIENVNAGSQHCTWLHDGANLCECWGVRCAYTAVVCTMLSQTLKDDMTCSSKSSVYTS